MDAGFVALGGREAAELLERHGIEPRKALGQNFVVDPNTIDRIVRLAEIGAGDKVVEIGPGIGSLTAPLADTGAEVVAVEIDGDLIPALQEQLGDRDVRVIHSDATTLDWSAELPGSGWKLVANLPYNVGTPLVLDLLDIAPQISEFTVMVQREVAERFAAQADTSDYGIPSVKVAYWATAKVVARVPPTVFIPKPNVESAVVRIVRRSTPAVEADADLLFSLVRTSFGQRRKMLRKSLASMVSAEAFEAAQVLPSARPAELDIAAWGRLANAVSDSGKSLRSV